MNRYINIYIYENEKCLVAAFAGSGAPEPLSKGGGGVPPRPGNLGQGGAAARKCC